MPSLLSSHSPSLPPTPTHPTSVLVGGRRGDGPAIVAAHKNHGGSQGGGKVESRVEVSLAGGAVAEVGHRNRVALVQLGMQEGNGMVG